MGRDIDQVLEAGIAPSVKHGEESRSGDRVEDLFMDGDGRLLARRVRWPGEDLLWLFDAVGSTTVCGDFDGDGRVDYLEQYRAGDPSPRVVVDDVDKDGRPDWIAAARPGGGYGVLEDRRFGGPRSGAATAKGT